MHMNLHHLSVFHTIAITGSITASSQQLHISQPALSHELKNLEDRLGVALFERLPRGMRLTHAGEVLRDYADRLFEIARTAESEMRAIAEARKGALTLGASNTIGTYVLPRLLAHFRRDNPDVRISLFVGNTAQISQGVADMRFALGFIEGPLHTDGLVAERFQDDELLPVVAAGHPLLSRKRLGIDSLDGEPLLVREAGSGTRELLMDMLQVHQVKLGSMMEFGNTEAIKQAAINGGGIAWLPRISMARELESGVLFTLPVKSLVINRPFRVIRRPRAHSSAVIDSFLALLSLQKQPKKSD
ncbi:MAG TPA: LysR family transcriptional regulator [Burkholderiaceae bacterium]|nr:LysR family transcriptional regulator [Burkholderiaceae bacterium]